MKIGMFYYKIIRRLGLKRQIKVYHGRLVIDRTSVISDASDFEGLNCIKEYSRFSGSMKYGSYIGHHCDIKANIGRFTSIAPFVTTNNGRHPFEAPFVATSPHFYSVRGYNGTPFTTEQKYKEDLPITIIGNDCWLGQGCFIAGGVTINDGAVVLAGACVVNDVPAYAVVGGVPAKIIKYRYDSDTISFLLRVKWWDNSIQWFQNHWAILNNLEEFKKYYLTI